MTDSIRLIVGLGNPGPQYHQTRHNAGFEWLDELVRHFGGQFKAENKYFGELATIMVGSEKIWLLKPMTFMNRSGQAVAALANFYRIPAEQILVAHDELDLPPGQAKLKQGGGHGGHNGLRDIIAKLGNNKNFCRLRLGIGHPGDAKLVSDFVLKKAPPSEYQLTQSCIDEAVSHIQMMVSGQWPKAMSLLNGFKAS